MIPEPILDEAITTAIADGAHDVVAVADGFYQTALQLPAIRTNGGTQMRAGFDEATVDEYAAIMREARGYGPFPPIVVYREDTTYWLADGFHRVEAARRCGWDPKIPAYVHIGTRRDAILRATASNIDHGLRRTNADKRRAVETLLRDGEWRAWTDAEIARRVGVDPKTVGNIRHALEATLEIPDTLIRKRVDGAPVDTRNIGSTRPARPVPPPAAARTVYDPPAEDPADPTPPDLAAAGYRIKPFGSTWYWRLTFPNGDIDMRSGAGSQDAAIQWARGHRKTMQRQGKLPGTPEEPSVEAQPEPLTPVKVPTVAEMLADTEAAYQAMFAGGAPAEPMAAPDTWAAGAVGLNRDWTFDELAAYEDAQQVIRTPDAPTDEVQDEAPAEASATLDDLPLVESETFPCLTAAERDDRRRTYAWLRTIYAEARDGLRMYENMTGDFASRGSLLRVLEPMIATLDRHLAVYEPPQLQEEA